MTPHLLAPCPVLSPRTPCFSWGILGAGGSQTVRLSEHILGASRDARGDPGGAVPGSRSLSRCEGDKKE